MKILHILNISIPDASGYAIRSKYIVEFQKKIGLAPVVITSPRQQEQRGEMEEINGIKYYRTSCNNNLFGNMLEGIPVLKEKILMKSLRDSVKEIAGKEKIDIIHAHSPILCGFPGLSVAREMRIPFFYEIRALWEDAAVDQEKAREGDLRYKITRYLETNLINRADGVITICDGIKRELIKRDIKEQKIHVIPNGVDTQKFIPIDRNYQLIKKLSVEDKKIIGFIGSFYKFEGLPVLLKSIKTILNNCKNVVFLIVGSGREEASLKNLAKELGVSDKIIFTGRVDHNSIMSYYSIIDVLVYPRLNRRITNLVTPLKPLEAMSMGKVVLASDVGGLKELVEDGETGVLFKSEDANDLASKCLYLLSEVDVREKISLNARQSMISDRDWSRIIPRYEEIYQKMIKRKTNEDN